MSGYHPELFFVMDGVSPAGSGAVCQWHTSSTDRSGSVDRVRTVPTGDLPPAARSRGAAPHPAAFEKGKTSRSEAYETFPIFSRHLRAAFLLLSLAFISSVTHAQHWQYLAKGLGSKAKARLNGWRLEAVSIKACACLSRRFLVGLKGPARPWPKRGRGGGPCLWRNPPEKAWRQFHWPLFPGE